MNTLSQIRDQLSTEAVKSETEAKRLIAHAKKLRAAIASLNGKPVSGTHLLGRRHRRKCAHCGRGFLSKHSDTQYCKDHRSIHRHRSKPQPKEKGRPRKRDRDYSPQTRSLAKARAVLARKRLEAKKAAAKAERRGTVLIPGDPLAAAHSAPA